MAVQRGIYLYNATVNSDTAVWCVGSTFSYGWKNMTSSDPVQGKFDITLVRQGGWENPTLTITGNIDVDDSDSSAMTETLIKDFARAFTSQLYISIGLGVDGTATPISTSTSGTTESTKGGKTGVWIPVVIRSFSFLPQGEMGSILPYQLVLVEDTG